MQRRLKPKSPRPPSWLSEKRWRRYHALLNRSRFGPAQTVEAAENRAHDRLRNRVSPLPPRAIEILQSQADELG